MTCRLVILSEQFRGKTLILDKEIVSCGRSSTLDLCIPDSTISSHHCDFIRSGATYIIRDVGSTNGTRVNNQTIMEQELHNTDILQIGGIELLYDTDTHDSLINTKTRTNINLKKVDSTLVCYIKPISSKHLQKHLPGQQSIGSKIFLYILMILSIIIIGLLVYLSIELIKAQQIHLGVEKPQDSISKTVSPQKYVDIIV